MEVVAIKDVVLDMNGQILSEDESGSFEGIIRGRVFNSKGNPILKGIWHNKLLLQGANLILERMTGKRSSFQPQTLNGILSITDTVPNDTNLQTDVYRGFVCGLSNNSGMYGDKPAVNEADRNLYTLLPFRIEAEELTGADKDKYFLHVLKDGKHYYYGKRFETDPDTKVEFENGSEVPIDVSNPQQAIRKYNEYSIKVDEKDLVEYFKLNPDALGRRVTALGLVTGFPSGLYEIHHAQLATKSNIDALPLSEAGSFAELRYQVFVK